MPNSSRGLAIHSVAPAYRSQPGVPLSRLAASPRSGIMASTEAPEYFGSVDEAGQWRVAGFKIVVQDVPRRWSRGLIVAWIASTRCPAPRDVNRLPMDSGRAQVLLTFERADLAVAALNCLNDCDLEPGAPFTRTSWWRPPPRGGAYTLPSTAAPASRFIQRRPAATYRLAQRPPNAHGERSQKKQNLSARQPTPSFGSQPDSRLAREPRAQSDGPFAAEFAERLARARRAIPNGACLPPRSAPN